MIDVLAADRWIYARLTTDPAIHAAVAGRVYMNSAPQQTAYPLITYSLVGSEIVAGICADPVMTTETWQVTVWHDRPNYTAIEAVAEAVVTAFHKQKATGIIGCVYRGNNRLSENNGDTEYRGIALEFVIFVE